MSCFIRTHIPRSKDDRKVARELALLGVATVAESQDRTGIIDPGIRPIQEGKSVAGRAVTVTCSDGDNLMLHAALEFCRNGDILVVTTMTGTKHGMFGELLGTACIARGIAGLVIDGGVRDTRELRELGFPVWTRYIYVAGTSKTKPGWVNANVVCGGVTVCPGDFVVANDDGVVVVRSDTAKQVLEKAKARVHKEAGTRTELSKGTLTLDHYDMRPRLAALNMKHIDVKSGSVSRKALR